MRNTICPPVRRAALATRREKIGVRPPESTPRLSPSVRRRLHQSRDGRERPLPRVGVVVAYTRGRPVRRTPVRPRPRAVKVKPNGLASRVDGRRHVVRARLLIKPARITPVPLNSIRIHRHGQRFGVNRVVAVRTGDGCTQ